MWKTIPGFPEHYEVSDEGQIRTWLVRGSKMMAENPTEMVGRLMRGYPTVLLRDLRGQRKNVRVHQAVLSAFAGPCPPGYQARHLDGNRTNNHLVNLKWGTPKENSDDKRGHGTMVVGERTLTAKLQASDIVAIRALLRRGHGLAFTASLFGMSKRMVARIRDGLSWDEVRDRDEVIKQANECPATLGCLLHLAREAYEPLARFNTGFSDMAAPERAYMVLVHTWTERHKIDERKPMVFHGASLAECLVAALEAAP